MDPDTIISTLHSSAEKAQKHEVHARNAVPSLTPYSSRYNSKDDMSKFIIPNLASFVGTYLDREADAFILENINKIISDVDEAPALMAMHVSGKLKAGLDRRPSPKEEKTGILRVVIPGSMSLDLLDRLISDIITETQTLRESDIGDLSALPPTATDKRHQCPGFDAEHWYKHGNHRAHRIVS